MAGAIQIWENKILFRDEFGGVAADEACCCIPEVSPSPEESPTVSPSPEASPTDCCPGLWPSDLLLTITDGPAGCDCIGNSVTISAGAVEDTWDFAFMPMDGNCGPFSISFACDEVTGKYTVSAIDAWSLEKYANSCDPFSLTGTPTWDFVSPCDGIVIEITENPLP